jgi:DNA-binding transcriptional MerR regulator
MAEQRARGATVSHLSIGEVLGLLLEEFPDVTISKIRFLESQGLIDPERTPSGYRKFYEDDVELLRCILREQRENFLPLRVIKDRLDSGQIDPTGETERPRGIRNVPEPDNHPSARGRTNVGVSTDGPIEPADGEEPVTGAAALFTKSPTGPSFNGAPEPTPSGGLTRPGLRLTADEIRSMSGLSGPEFDELVSYQVVAPGPSGDFGEDALEVAKISKRFLDDGVDARHLRSWRVAADREAGLFAQLIQPLMRQRNPASHAQAIERLTELEQLGSQLRSAMMHTALSPHLGD